MFAWGNTVNGELGLGGIEEEQVLSPKQLNWSEASSIIYAACGESHSLLLSSHGQVYACGSNDHGQLGHNQPRKRPQLVAGLDAYSIKKVACGATHSVAVTEWGQLLSWGSDMHGQLGHGRLEIVTPQPKVVRALATKHVVQVQCGLNHTLALTNNGEIYAFGANHYGQLGVGTQTQYESNPTLIQSLAGIPIVLIACGGNHSFAVSKSGAVFGWGSNSSGQLGLNDIVNKLYPTQVKSMRSYRVRYIACGDEFSVFLTLDGGVFTCGHGQYGQLGHGSTSNEILPRKVSELMGSVITQISCGRRHTLALIPSSKGNGGRIYGFGLGGAGQLGSNMATKSVTPQLVFGPWLPTVTQSQTDCVYVNRIFAGGDHCFATVFKRDVDSLYDSTCEPYDCRQLDVASQIWQLSPDKIECCLKLSETEIVDQDLITYIECVFASLACLNGSFLLDDRHYCCTSANNGLDFNQLERTFAIIARIENASVKCLIWSCIVDVLLKNLSTSPPDVESLRIYLILPHYHEFNNPKNYQQLHKLYCRFSLQLTTNARRVIALWLNASPNDYFERLVNMLKEVVLYVLRIQNLAQREQTIQEDESLRCVLDVLGNLTLVNRYGENMKIPYTCFNVPEIIECYNVRLDYLKWLLDTRNQGFYLCNYPYLFDAKAKTQLLETDQSLQMKQAMDEAATRAFTQMFLLPNVNRALCQQFVVLEVSRENIVNDTLSELAKYDTRDLKMPLKVKFINEEAEDAGGVRKEFFMLLSREILNPMYGMFKQYEETNTIWFSEDSFEEAVMYQLIGLLCGLAIYNFTIINLPFPLALYKKILKEPVLLSDLRELSPSIANSLQSILDYNEPDLQEVFNLNFELSREVFGETRTSVLKPGGDTIPVTLENKKEFVDLYVDFVLNKSCEQHFDYFRTGFMKVCGGRVMKLFHAHELMAVVVGNEDYDWDALERNAEYKNGYIESDQTIRWFWEVLKELTLTDKKNFLLFLTGSDRIPIQGMDALKIYIQPTTDEKFLPVAHTCFNLLDLPRYKTKERLKYKLLQAIQQTQGFSLV